MALTSIINTDGEIVPSQLRKSGEEALEAFGKKAIRTLCSEDCSNCKACSYHAPFCGKQEELFGKYKRSPAYLFDWLVYKTCKIRRDMQWTRHLEKNWKKALTFGRDT